MGDSFFLLLLHERHRKLKWTCNNSNIPNCFKCLQNEKCWYFREAQNEANECEVNCRVEFGFFWSPKLRSKRAFLRIGPHQTKNAKFCSSTFCRILHRLAKYPAETEGFEPSIPFRGIHTFQACSFNHSDKSPFYFFIHHSHFLPPKAGLLQPLGQVSIKRTAKIDRIEESPVHSLHLKFVQTYLCLRSPISFNPLNWQWKRT